MIWQTPTFTSKRNLKLIPLPLGYDGAMHLMLRLNILGDEVKRRALYMGTPWLVNLDPGELFKIPEQRKVLPCVDSVPKLGEIRIITSNVGNAWLKEHLP